MLVFWQTADVDVDALKAALERVADAETQISIGNCYAEGKGVQQDRVEAFRLDRKAAEMGLAEAQYNLGTLYLQDWGVEKNEAEALKWYRKAAAKGCKPADDMIALLTRKQ